MQKNLIMKKSVHSSQHKKIFFWSVIILSYDKQACTHMISYVISHSFKKK